MDDQVMVIGKVPVGMSAAEFADLNLDPGLLPNLPTYVRALAGVQKVSVHRTYRHNGVVSQDMRDYLAMEMRASLDAECKDKALALIYVRPEPDELVTEMVGARVFVLSGMAVPMLDDWK